MLSIFPTSLIFSILSILSMILCLYKLCLYIHTHILYTVLYIYIDRYVDIFKRTCMHYNTLHYTMNHTTLHCTAGHCIASLCTALHCMSLHYVTLHYITFIDAYMLYNDAKRCKDAKHVIHIFFSTIIEPHCQCSILCSTDSGPEIVEIMLTLAGHVALYQLLLLILICVSYFLTSYIFHPLNYYGITESLNKLPCLVTSVVKSVPKSSSLRLICLFS